MRIGMRVLQSNRVEIRKMNLAKISKEINKIKDSYYSETTLESLTAWVLGGLWADFRTNTHVQIDNPEEYVLSYNDSLVVYNFENHSYRVAQWDGESAHMVGIHVSGYLFNEFGVETFKELREDYKNYYITLDTLENISAKIARDISDWVSNIGLVFEAVGGRTN